MDKTVFVTGADRGLGLELAKGLLKEGCKVFAGRYLVKWKNLIQLKAEYEDSLTIVDIDISDDESVKEAARLIMGKTDSLDILINNAAINENDGFQKRIFDKLDFKNMLDVYNVNALGPLRVTNALIDLVLKSYNKLIINISSEAGSIGTCWRQEGFAYCMSKAALNMQAAIIHNSLHREFNGQVINIHPGGMQTHFDCPPDRESEQTETPAMKMFLTPDFVAGCIIDIIKDQERFKSDKPAFINYRGDRIPW